MLTPDFSRSLLVSVQIPALAVASLDLIYWFILDGDTYVLHYLSLYQSTYFITSFVSSQSILQLSKASIAFCLSSCPEEGI